MYSLTVGGLYKKISIIIFIFVTMFMGVKNKEFILKFFSKKFHLIFSFKRSTY